MNCQNKNDTPSVCKNHSARSDKDLYRVCTSKLSKKELEDIYFTLLENNLELKKINNIQQDNIKLLSTKVQRMTATQKSTIAKENKDCCANTKALVKEHKGTISELKRANERMSERIRVLNMRLCSAKQFLRRSPAACSKCAKCFSLNAKRSNVSEPTTKRSDSNLKTSVSSQCLDKNFMTSSTVEKAAINDNSENHQQPVCDENKCRTQIESEELQQKIVDIQEELFKTHEDYTARITRLEDDLARVKNDNQRLRDEHAADEYELQQQRHAVTDLGQRLRAAEVKQSELETQLVIEKRKVTELETNARAAELSRHVAVTIERHLNTSLMKTEDNKLQLETISSPYPSPSRLETPSKTQGSHDKSNQKMSDDSGYTEEANKSREEDKNKELNQLDKDIFDRISLFQEKMEELKTSAVKSSTPTIEVCESRTRIASRRHSFEPKLAVSLESHKQEKRNMFDDMSISIESVKAADGKMLSKNPELLLDDQEIANEEKIDLVQSKLSQEEDSNLKDETSRKKPSQKSDRHNSLQIPGPLPLDTFNKEESITHNAKSAVSKFKQLIDYKRRKNTKNSADASMNKKDEHVKKCMTESISIESERRKSETENNGIRTLTELMPGDIKRKAATLKEKGIANIEKEGLKKVQTCIASVETEGMLEKGLDLGIQTDELKRGPRKGSADDASATYNIPHPKAPFTALGGPIAPYNAPGGSSDPNNVSADALSHRSGGNSPDNTDAEISSLTDLPSEKDSKSPRTPLSPGEEKATTTYTDSYTHPETDYGSLSEGELPSPIKDKKLSAGETKVNFAINGPVSHRMEEALQAVSQELVRCRQLLGSQRPQSQVLPQFTYTG